MEEKTSKGNIKELDDKIIDALLNDPTKSMREIAKDLNSYRQTLWRKKKKMEEENLIWGYTAVIDEEKQGKVTFLVLMKTKPMMKGLADLIVRRVKRNEPSKMNIRLIDLFQVNGEYDWVLRFSAPDHATARTYFDTLRALYVDYLLEKPVLVNVNFILVAEGKRNPEIDKLFNFVIAP
ncbi:MAG: Lrp/AsnC family transcriptional regulator [Thermoplasmatota archaeon]